MANKIELRSLQTILGNMIARLAAETDFDDLNPGSAFMTILEAAALQDFMTEGKLLRILNLRNIDESTGTDLEKLGTELGLDPARLGATSSTVILTVKDSSFDKISTNIYAGAVSPTAGDTVIKIVEGEDLPTSGKVYVGRGSRTSEILNYSSLVDNGSYWTLNLSAPLTKDHLVGEEVILSQGGDRVIGSGTTAVVEGVAGVQSIEFATQVDYFMQDGEDTLDGIIAVSLQTGSQSVVGRKKISSFRSTPFSGATVTNETPSTGGRDEETDPQLRQRIKDHPHTLSGGTETAILRAVIGTQDDEESKRVVSAYLRRPATGKDQVVLYIDDGTGFAPTFSGVGEEVMVIKATGKESFFQLQKWPVVKTQVATIAKEPFALNGTESLYVEVDGQYEERILAANYRTPNVVSAQEVAEVINRSFSSIEARAKDGLLFISPVADDPDWIRVGSATYAADANAELRFPVTKQYTIRLYRNDRLMEKNGTEAGIQTLPYNQWANLASTETVQFKVDGIPSTLLTYTDILFRDNTFSNTIEGASLLDWVTVLNKTLIGITSSVRDDGTIALKSNRGRSDQASIEIFAGTLAEKIFPINSAATGTSPEYSLNKLLGQIELLVPLEEGEELKAGTVNTRGFALTPTSSTYNLAGLNANIDTDYLGLAGEMCVVADATFEEVFVAPLGNLTFTANGIVLTLTSDQNDHFANVKPNDIFYAYNTPRDGVLRVLSCDGDVVTLADPAPASGSVNLETNGVNVKFFRTEGLPQIVKFPIGSVIPSTLVVNAFNAQLLGVKAEEIETGAIRINTTRFDGKGGLSICAVSGSASTLNIVAQNYQSNDPHFASIESADLTGTPSKRYAIVIDDFTAPYAGYKIVGNQFDKSNHNKPIFTYLGSNSRLLRQPFEKLSANTLRLRTTLPTQLTPTGKDSRGTSVSGIEVGPGDNMVFLIDNDPARKTFDIPMYVEGTIAGPSVPSSLEFDVNDSASIRLGADKWLGHRFEDYRVWFQARNFLPASDVNSKIKITAVNFGPNGEKIKVGVIYPKDATSPMTASYSVDPINKQILVNIQLASADARALGLIPSKKVTVTGGVNTIRVGLRPPADLVNVAPGDILSLDAQEFSAANRGQYRIHTVNNVFDNGHAYGHYDHASVVTISAQRNITLAVPSPKTIKVGDRMSIDGLIRVIDQVTSQTSFRVAAPGYALPLMVSQTTFTNGTPTTTTVQDTTPIVAIITSQDLSADSPLPFTVVAGEIIEIGGTDYVIEEVLTPVDFKIAVAQQFLFAGVRSGTISRMYVEANKFGTSITETVIASSADSVVIFGLPEEDNAADVVVSLINNTAGIKDLIKAEHASTSDGSGLILNSTQEVLAGTGTHVSLLNGESFVYSTSAASPCIRLKEASIEAPLIGEKIRLIPTTPKNIADHLARKQISGLSVAADVELVDAGKRVQVTSKTPGGEGQVFAVGGRASGLNIFKVRGNAQELSSTTAMLELDRSAIELFSTGHLIKITQPSSAKKRIGTLTAFTQINIQVPALGYAQVKINKELTKMYSYFQSGSVWAVRNIGRNRIRFEIYAGAFTLPAELRTDDWVLVGNGDSYAGVTTTKDFSPANRGWYQVRETDNQTYFDVDGKGVEEFALGQDRSFIFCSYHSPRVGDKLVLGSGLPLSSNNKGTYLITQIIDPQTVMIQNPQSATQDWIELGATIGVDFGILDQGFSTYRKVEMFAPKADDPTNKSVVVVSPGIDMSLFSEGQGAVISMPNRLGYGTDPVPGVSGYNYWTGLKRKVQRVVDAYAPDTAQFPGVGAAGVFIEVREPSVQRVKIAMKVKTSKGVSLQSLSDTIKSAIAGYINSLGLGEDVVMSEVIKLVQQIPGIDALVLTAPVPATERVSVGDKSIARISADDITLS